MTIIDFEKDAKGRITFDAFVKGYGPAQPELIEPWMDAHTRGVYLRTRVPDGCGYFGAEAKDARWCEPHEWHRLYFAARKAQYPEGFA